MVIGPSKAGKSRTAFEAALGVLPEAVLIAPRPGRRALDIIARGDLLDACCPDRQVVVWLDDLERFLAPSEGFDTGRLAQLGRRSPRLMVLATLRTDQLARQVQPGTTEIDKTVRQLLESAEQVRLELSLSDGERERAAAAYPDEDFAEGVGIGERLVAGPELRDKRLAARLDEPVRWCLAKAAVDWRRIGMHFGQVVIDFPDQVPSRFVPQHPPREGGRQRWRTTGSAARREYQGHCGGRRVVKRLWPPRESRLLASPSRTGSSSPARLRSGGTEIQAPPGPPPQGY